MAEDVDGGLARRAAAGDREAFGALLERHYDRIYRIGARVLGDADEAADLAQDVCVALPARLASWRGESRFTTWLYRVVVNAARDALRRKDARTTTPGPRAARPRSGRASRSSRRPGTPPPG